MTRGFVKLPRSFFACPLWTEPRRRTNIEAYFDLLQRQAFHNTSVPQTSGHIDLKSGQLFISCRKLAQEWNWQGREVKDFLEYLRDLRIAKLEEMQAGYRITLYEPIADPSKNILVNSFSSEESSKEEISKKNSEKPTQPKLPESDFLREYRKLHEDFPGVLESVEFIQFKERKRIELRKPAFSPTVMRDLILEYQAEQTKKAEDSKAGSETATSPNSESATDDLQESIENA